MLKHSVHELILRAWQHKNALFYLVLIPVSWLFSFVVSVRRNCYKYGLLRSHKLSAPVIVVGNINMGGSGKTPVVIWLAKQLKKSGYNPGVISRGYGTQRVEPIEAKPSSLATDVGDEPLLIAKRTDCPVWIGANRVDAGKALLEANPACDIIISDDGLQHYRLQRAIEIAVVDEQTSAAEYRLPAGPLREPLSRLQTVDAIICNGQKIIANAFEMKLQGRAFYNLTNPKLKVLGEHFKNKSVKALAGIGNPGRFFNYLKSLGLDFESLRFEDHHAFSAEDLEGIECEVLIMTEKDAVKCQHFAKKHHWVLPVDAKMDATLLPMLLAKLKKWSMNRG
ncbi:MAG: tetraacyldisaccharide 4'-kinase [Methylophilaceae bacterium]